MVATMGLLIGTIRRKKIVYSFAPSMRAASIKESGRFTRYCLARKTPVGVAAGGMMMPHKELSIPKFLSCRKIGIMITCKGIMSVAIIMVKIRFLPVKIYLAKAYPAIKLTRTVMKVETTATNTVLEKYTGKFPAARLET